MMAQVSAATLAAGHGVHIRAITLIYVLIALVVIVGIVYAVGRARSRGKEPRSWQ